MSRAYSKSKKSSKPEIFLVAANVMTPSISLKFSPINLPFINPVSSLAALEKLF